MSQKCGGAATGHERGAGGRGTGGAHGDGARVVCANFAGIMTVGREPGAPAGKHRAARGGEPPRAMRVPRDRA